MKFWRSTRKVKAVKEEDYQTQFKGKRRIKKPIPVLVSDSDSDFENPRPQTESTSERHDNDGIVRIDPNKLDTIDQRLKNLEAELSAQSEVIRL